MIYKVYSLFKGFWRLWVILEPFNATFSGPNLKERPDALSHLTHLQRNARSTSDPSFQSHPRGAFMIRQGFRDLSYAALHYTIKYSIIYYN